MRLRRNTALSQVERILLTAIAAAVLSAPSAPAQEPGPPLPPPRPSRAGPPNASGPAQKDNGSSQHEASAPADFMDDAACQTRITRLGVRFEPRVAVMEGLCTVQEPVLVSSLPDGVEVSPASLMTCPLAEALARWSLDVVSAEADRHFQSAPTKALIGTSYQCRNQRSGGKLSEHAFGNGADIVGFEFRGHAPLRIGAHPGDSPELAFQNAIRKGACSLFTTVLGPGADADHGDHLHLDLRGRGGGYRICQ